MGLIRSILRFRLNLLFSKKRGAIIPLYLVKRVIRVLCKESISQRPRDNFGNPGGLVYLKKDLKTVVIPDLHGRVNYLRNILNHEIEGETVFDLLLNRDIQLIFLGDYFHSEHRGKERWLKSYEEYKSGFSTHENMDMEMAENLNLLKILFILKVKFSENIFLLKGNHENILNEDGNGNCSFYKYALEGEMVKSYMLKFRGRRLTSKISEFEKMLPVLAVGDNSIFSHSEPKKFNSRSSVIGYRYTPSVIHDLTWTPDNAAEVCSVESMLKHYLPDKYQSSFYFGGHRPVKGLYNLHSHSRYVQLHNPLMENIVILYPGEDIKLEKSLVVLTGGQNGNDN